MQEKSKETESEQTENKGCGNEQTIRTQQEEMERIKAPFLYSAEEMQAVESYISECFGKFSTVIHELVSPDIHVDICLIPPCPQEGRNFFTLVTMGMGAYRMNVPKELEEYRLERAELLIRLPEDWRMEQEAFSDECWYWPLRLLKKVARLPVQEESWLGWGHTIEEEEGESYAKNTKLCSCMLTAADLFEEETWCCELPNGEEVNFYQILPLYKEEMEYKLSHGAQKLLECFPAEMTQVLDISRPNAITDTKLF